VERDPESSITQTVITCVEDTELVIPKDDPESDANHTAARSVDSREAAEEMLRRFFNRK